MRIAIDIRSLIDGRVSGVEEYTTNIIHALQRVGPHHEYHLFYNATRRVALPEFSGSTIHAFRYPNTLFNVAQWGWGWPRWDTLLPADCFFVPSLRLVPLSARMPLVTTVHDLSFERFPYFFSWRRRLWHGMMRPRHLLHHSDHLIAVSGSTARDIASLYHISRQKITVIYSGVPHVPPVTSPTHIQQVRQRYHLPARFILYFGTLEPRKNIPSTIRAFSAIAHRIPHHLVIAGARGWLTDAMDAAVANSLVSRRIHLTGFVDPADKMALYALADLFVYPSFYEGFGFPPLEALLAGTPVITSYTSSLPEIVGRWALLVNPADPGELAAVMLEALQHPLEVTPTIQREIHERYSWDKAARATLAVLEKAVT